MSQTRTSKKAGSHRRLTRMGAQGDVLFRRVDKLPTGTKVEEIKGPIVVAHSETGHHHSIDDPSGVERHRLGDDPMICYLRLEADAEVIHHRPFDTHAPVVLTGPGVWEVRRQREYTPQGLRRVED